MITKDHFLTPSLQMVCTTLSSLLVRVSSAPNPCGKSFENCPEYQQLAFHRRPKPCFTPSFHSPKQTSSILYSSRMLMLFLRPEFRKSQMFLTGWNLTMLAPLKLIPSPLGCAFWKKPSQQQPSIEQMPQPSQRPSRNCPVQHAVRPHPSYLSSRKYPSYDTLPFALYYTPKPFFRERLIYPSKITLLFRKMMLQPSIESPEMRSDFTKQSPTRTCCIDCNSSAGKEVDGSDFLGLVSSPREGPEILMK